MPLISSAELRRQTAVQRERSVAFARTLLGASSAPDDYSGLITSYTASGIAIAQYVNGEPLGVILVNEPSFLDFQKGVGDSIARFYAEGSEFPEGVAAATAAPSFPVGDAALFSAMEEVISVFE